MTKLIGISSSLRRGSFNTALLRAAAEFVPNGAELTVAHKEKIYPGQHEAIIEPELWQAVQDRLAAGRAVDGGWRRGAESVGGPDLR